MPSRILIIDDAPANIQTLSTILKERGYDINIAIDGRQGLELLERIRPDLILLDIMMPEIDGFKMNKLLLENKVTQNIPVIILTAKGQVRTTFEMTPNIKYFMEKPFDPKDLQTKVLDALREN